MPDRRSGAIHDFERHRWLAAPELGHGYSEAVMRQDTESFLRCLENALRHFGGAPLLLNIDYVPRNIIDIVCPSALCALAVDSPLMALGRDPGGNIIS